VIAGPVTDDGLQRWYFSLNNRRLWVLKRCREEGLLLDTDNKILVRVREPKSQNEIERYTIQNCAIEAKIIREKQRKHDAFQVHDRSKSKNDINEGNDSQRSMYDNFSIVDNDADTDGNSDDDLSDDSNTSSESNVQKKASNRFNALV
jgi:hypothetical protein